MSEGVAEEIAWPDVLGPLIARRDLDAAHTAWAMARILAGEATPAQVSAFIVALRSKGETVEELTGLVEAMLDAATAVTIPGRLLDIVGTGGDRLMSVNISTMSSIVAAGAGVTVVKHGNRASSSKSGSADTLEALGLRLDLPVERVAAVAEEVGITFLFANAVHAGMRHAGPVRREIGVGTTFNFLGPLANPARPAASAIGVASLDMAPRMAGVFAARGDDAWLFRGDDGLDELTVTAPSRIWRVHDGVVTEHIVEPEEFGLRRAAIDDLRGGEAAENAAVLRRVLGGEPGAVRDAVLLNAGAGLAVHDAEGGPLHEKLAAGIARAQESIDSGAALAKLEEWIAATHS